MSEIKEYLIKNCFFIRKLTKSKYYNIWRIDNVRFKIGIVA